MLSITSNSNSPAVSSASKDSLTSTSWSSSVNTFTSKHKLWSSFIRTLNDSGIPGSGIFSPLTIASYALTRPTTSSDLTVSISWSMWAAPYASRAQTSISPNLCPPNCALPPNGCWVTKEYGPVLLACNLSSTRWCSFNMYMYPTVILLSKVSPVLPSYKVNLPSSGYPACTNAFLMSDSLAPSNTDVATYHPKALAASPKWTSSTWPMFIRDGIPCGLRTISSGVPSSVNGMSSCGNILEITPLLPWRPAILSPTFIFLFWAI